MAALIFTVPLVVLGPVVEVEFEPVLAPEFAVVPAPELVPALGFVLVPTPESVLEFVPSDAALPFARAFALYEVFAADPLQEMPSNDSDKSRNIRWTRFINKMTP